MHAEAVEEEKVKMEVEEEEMEEEEEVMEEEIEERLQERQTGGEIESPLFILA